MSAEKLNMERHTQRKLPSPEQIRAKQKADAEREFGQQQAKIAETLPAKAEPTAVAIPDIRTASQAWADEVAPASIVGRLIKFTKDGVSPPLTMAWPSLTTSISSRSSTKP